MHRTFDSSSLESHNSAIYHGSDSGYSGRSDKSYHTSLTEYGSSDRPRHLLKGATGGVAEDYYESAREKSTPPNIILRDPRSSTETYASTIDLEVETQEQEGDGDLENDVSIRRPLTIYPSDVLPTTPADFSALFPSSRMLLIRHDDSTDDGNMNLRLDTTLLLPGGRTQDMTLFHLRMHDLKKREFSLRRYCRDSGREVCHSFRRYQEPANERKQNIARSLSSVLAALKPKSESKAVLDSNLKRADSGYGSICARDSTEAGDKPEKESKKLRRSSPPVPTNTTKLEFANYAQVDVKRRGTKNKKRYAFEYWGNEYCWRRCVDKAGGHARTCFHLQRSGQTQVLATIEPLQLSYFQSSEEESKGGWIPPCALQIIDRHLLEDRNEVTE